MTRFGVMQEYQFGSTMKQVRTGLRFRGCRQRLPLFHHEHADQLERAGARVFRVVHFACGDGEGIAGLQLARRLAVDQQFAYQSQYSNIRTAHSRKRLRKPRRLHSSAVISTDSRRSR